MYTESICVIFFITALTLFHECIQVFVYLKFSNQHCGSICCCLLMAPLMTYHT